jgi:hypothetical protein
MKEWLTIKMHSYIHTLHYQYSQYHKMIKIMIFLAPKKIQTLSKIKVSLLYKCKIILIICILKIPISIFAKNLISQGPVVWKTAQFTAAATMQLANYGSNFTSLGYSLLRPKHATGNWGTPIKLLHFLAYITYSTISPGHDPR